MARRRFGYRRLCALVRRDGEKVNHKRVYRLYVEEQLWVRKRNRKRRGLPLSRSLSEFRRNAPVAIAPPMFHRDLLNRGSHHVSFHRLWFLQPAVQACPAHLGQLTHALDRQATAEAQN
jgi:hypothetical protein